MIPAHRALHHGQMRVAPGPVSSSCIDRDRQWRIVDTGRSRGRRRRRATSQARIFREAKIHENQSCHRIRGRQAARDRHGGSRRAARRRSTGRDQGDRHLPYRRVHALRCGSGGAVSRHLRPRRRRHRGGRGGRRDLGEERRPRHSPLHAGMPAVQIVHVAQDEPVHGDPRHAGQGRHARRHEPVLHRQADDPPLHGMLDVFQFHRAAGDRRRKDSRGRAVRQGVLHRLRRDHRDRRGHQHREGGAGRERGGVRPRRHRAQRHPGRKARGREQDRRRRLEPAPQGARREIRHDALRQSEGSRRATSSLISSSSRTAARITASNASATSTSCARRWSAATAAGAYR